ncbi:MAG TPA: DUF2087 domain-containing protein [Ideonella sp.]|uniref:DUF2087 domain-containing protein n=1 Tax=Ideonella sp. TaxID=1929293 RepID=UPI002E2F67F8|nr:DUF2087 domain-containing protein [Ideonella sp.]HEX5687279.1 DUF2087 domain-containing protein [Ideonella sp.]
MTTIATTSPVSTQRGRALVPLHCDDLSQFAKTLRQQLGEHLEKSPGAAPSHVQLLNMLARAAGHRSVQALRAQATLTRVSASATAPPAASTAPTATLGAHATKALTQFDEHGRLARWPYKFAVQRLAMWGLWLRFESNRTYTEREVNEILKAWTTYGDHVTPRRELVEMKLLGRKPDCSAYWKEPQRPTDEVRALLQALRARR